VIEIYKENLPFVETFDTELIIWKQQFLNIKTSPSTLRDTLNICDKGWFPNIFVILQEEFEDTKGVIRIHIPKKNRQHNGQKKKYKRTSNDLQNIYIKLKIK